MVHANKTKTGIPKMKTKAAHFGSGGDQSA